MAHHADSRPSPDKELWPSLPLQAWRDTCETLHMWTQIVGKVRLAQAPLVNHWWQVPLYVTARGLTTSPIPYGEQVFQIDFDFIDHQLVLSTMRGEQRRIALEPRSVADFYQEFMGALRALGIEVRIWTQPVEIEHIIRFEEDRQHASYDPEYARRFWQVLVQADRVMKEFRARFIGKCSPVHFFWGSFDMAVTRFSGRRAPPHPGGVPNLAPWVVLEAYSHECSSCGFWPGSGPDGFPTFYAYAYPEPEGFENYPVRPSGARYSKELREFILPYEEVRQAANPSQALMEFFQSTYEAAAELGAWDRAELERPGADAAGGRPSGAKESTFPAQGRGG